MSGTLCHHKRVPPPYECRRNIYDSRVWRLTHSLVNQSSGAARGFQGARPAWTDGVLRLSLHPGSRTRVRLVWTLVTVTTKSDKHSRSHTSVGKRKEANQSLEFLH